MNSPASVHPRSRRQAAVAVPLAAVATALVAALVQVTFQLTNAIGRGRIIFASRDVIWMAPLSWSALFLLVAVPLVALAVAFPRFDWLRWTLSLFICLAVVFLLIPVGQLSTWAAVVVGAGVGYQVGRLCAGGRPWGIPALRNVALLLAGAFALAGGLGRAARADAERRSVATLSQAVNGAPNVVLIVLDAVRAANLSTYGYARQTSPQLDALAREGVSFDRAYAVAPWTLPSHASMFTGRYPNALGADYLHRLERTPLTIGEVFRARGYRTAGFTANEFYTSWDAGLNRGFERWSDYRVSWKQIRLSGWPWQAAKLDDIARAGGWRDVIAALRYSALRAPHALLFDRKHSDQVRQDFLAWQSTVPAKRPFFAFLNLFDAHRPRYAPPQFETRFTKTPKGADRYDNAIAYEDHEVGQLISALREQGSLDNTIVVVVGDHGELMGEHGLYGHSSSVYRDVLWVPFVVRYPARIKRGVRVTSPVSLRDLAATIIDLADAGATSQRLDDSSLSTGGPPVSAAAQAGAGAGGTPQGLTSPSGQWQRLPGTSLVSLITHPDGARSPVFSYAHQGVNVDPGFPNAAGPVLSLVMDSLHYIRHPGNAEFLFNIVGDPAERVNLTRDPRFARVQDVARREVSALTRNTPSR